MFAKVIGHNMRVWFFLGHSVDKATISFVPLYATNCTKF